MTVRTLTYLWVVLLTSQVSLLAQSSDQSITFEGQRRTFRVFLPKGYNGTQRLPLVLNLHGYGSNAVEQELYTGMFSVADTAQFIVVHPNGLRDATGRQYWNTFEMPSQNANDLGFFNALLDTLQARYRVDPLRIYSMGMSNGGFMSYDLACRLSHRIAAVASVTGSMLNSRLATCKPPRPVPVLQIHGTADGTVPYNGSTLLMGFAPIESVVDFWVRHNQCNPTPLTLPIPDVNKTDGSTADRFVYTGGRSGSTVEFFRINNGGHTWPGGLVIIGVTNYDFNASQEIWRFFRQYRLNLLSSTETATEATTLAYPNPCHSTVLLKTEATATVHIFDAQGRLVWQGDTLAETPIRVETAAWPSGVYTLRTLQRGQVATKMLVKQ